MTKEIELKTSGAEPLTQLLPLASDQLAVATLQNAAAALVADDKSFSLRYTDSDGDEVTIAHDADVKELADYMADEQLERVTVLVTPQKPRAMQTQLRGLVAAMSKLTTAKPKKPTAANAMNLLVASLQTMDVAEDSDELAAVKKELLGVLQDEEFKKVVEELSASEEFKELADAMVAAIYEENAQAIEETATARFEELLKFAQNVVACCPAVKPAMINVAKQCMSGLVRLNDEELEDDDSDASSIDSMVEEMKGFAAQGFEAQEAPVHFGIICDGCEQNPLVGVRYKSLEVADFDLCEDCEASGKWMTHEPFIKISDPSRAPKQKRPSEVLIHTFVVCDGCEMSPIVGTRFKSKTADDFDLCEKCEASGKWTKSHGPFAKIDEPGTMKFICRRGGKFGDHGKFGRHHGHHGHHGKFDRHDHHCHHGKFGRHGHHHGPPGTPFHCHPPRHHGPPDFFGPPHHEGPGFPGHGPPHYDGPRDFPPPPPRREDSREFGGRDRSYFHGHRYGPPPPPPFPEFDRRWRHGPPGFGPPGCFGRFGPSPFGFEGPHGAPPGPQEFSPRGWHGFCGRRGHFPGDQEEQQEDDFPRSHHGCRRGDGWSGGASDLEARFLEDVTIEDGTVAEAGKPLRKMWKLLNDGERSWPDGCYMISKDDNPLLPGRPEESRIDLPALAPGEEFIATMDLLAPTQPGRYTSFWRVCDPAGASFGHRFWIDIVVAGNTAAETTPSEASTTDSTEDSEVKDVVEVSTPADAQSESDSDDDIEIIEAEDARSEQLTEMHKAFVEEQSRDAEMMEKYDQLESMGFADLGENLRALELADGDIGAAVNILLSE